MGQTETEWDEEEKKNFFIPHLHGYYYIIGLYCVLTAHCSIILMSSNIAMYSQLDKCELWARNT